jgi:hypothetical protein
MPNGSTQTADRLQGKRIFEASKRRRIEALFQNFKSRGFNLEATHLRDSSKTSKLLVY